jgi:hypothetical protein
VVAIVAARRTRWLARGCSLAALVLTATGCTEGPPEQRLEQPTAERLAARPNAVGVPYGRLVLIRHDGRLVAVRLRALSAFGKRVTYDWYRLDRQGRGARTEVADRGRGETAENPHTGRISIPGGPSLVWSRGSQTSGWLYWPEQGPEIEFYSHAFAELAAVDPGSGSGRWLSRRMFSGSSR